MAVTNARPRSRSQAHGHGRQSSQPPARAIMAAGNAPPPPGVPRRVAMPRAASSPNLHTIANGPTSFFEDDDDDESEWTKIAREKIDTETLRALARFFKNTEPPSVRGASIETQRDCFGTPALALGDKRRWSLQSLRRNNRRSRADSGSLRSQVQRATGGSTTAAGHRYIPILAPLASDQQLSREASVLAARRSQTPQHVKIIEPGWPRRIESLENLSPTSPRSSSSLAGRLLPVKEEQSGDNRLSAANEDDRISARDSSLRLYGTMLRMLNQSPPIEDRVPSPATVPERRTQDWTAEPSKKIERARASPSPSVIHRFQDRHPSPAPSDRSRSSRPSSANNGDVRRGGRPVHRATASAAARPSHKRQLSAFPNTSKPQSQTAGLPRSSPREHKKPANLQAVNTTLQVPEQSLALDSPGFPKLLAAMSFPSPPESAPSCHSANNSVSLNGHQHSTDPSIAVFNDAVSPASDAPQRGTLADPNHDDGASPEPHHPAVMQDEKQTSPAPSARSDGMAEPDGREEPTSTASTTDRDARQSCASTTDTCASGTETGTDSHHYSMISDTTVTSDATATKETVDQREPTRRESCSSLNILERKRSRWSLMLNEKGSAYRDESTDDESSRARSSQRADSVSSTGTNKPAQSLAQRRRERREKVREKINKDINASMVSHLKVPDPVGLSDAVDSPVLGWFPPTATTASHTARMRKASIKDQSPLARSQESLDHGQNPEEPLAHDPAQPTHENVPEPGTIPISEPSACAMTDNDKVQDVEQLQTSNQLTLHVSPIMITANIEPYSPPHTLRPLSLRASGSPTTEAMSTLLRAETRQIVRQRPVPIKVSKSIGAEKVKVEAKSNRQSVPNMLTPPLSPDHTSPSRRMSLPSRGSSPKSSRHGHDRPSLDSRLSQLSRDQETKWLQAHQRQTAQEWREAALRERIRIEQLTKERNHVKSQRRSARLSLLDTVDVAETEADAEQPRQLSPRPISSRLSARKLNELAKVEEAEDSTANDSPARSNDEQGSRATSADADTSSESPMASLSIIEQRLRRLEKNGDDLSDVVVPLLESMNQLLRDIRKERVS